MDGLKVLVTLAIIALPSIGQGQAPVMKRITMKDPVVCYARFDNCASHVDAPQEFLRNKQARVQLSTIEVTYSGNFPENAKAAFEYAVSIWEATISSSVPIKIQANWSNLSPGVLGSALYWSAYANFEGAQKLNVFYPVALAEKIAGKELNGSEFEIFANFSANINWYFDTSGPPATGQYDFVTVVLHEIGHGLGFSSSFQASTTTGEVGAFDTEVPIIFDVPVENTTGTKLVQGYSSPSAALKTQLTSNSLRINVLKNSTGNAKLYAPTTFDGGSSISHLDEDTYTAGGLNALMTPQIGPQEVNHNPSGPLTLGILSDLGWETIGIQHQPQPNTETVTGPYTITVKLVNDAAVQYDASQVKLHYTSDGTNYISVDMADQGNDVFAANIPTPPSIPWSYGYYISAGDNVGRTMINPGKFVRVGQTEVQDLHVFEIGPDTKPPKVVHTPKPYLKESETELEIQATISDNIGIGSASIEYQINDGAFQTEPLTLTQPEDSVYSVTLNLGTLTDGDVIKYTITAIDNSNNPKTTISPSSDFYSVEVFGFAEPVSTYANNFNTSSNDFFGNGFSITIPSGFSNSAIHSIHPYEEGDAYPDDEIEFVYLLKIPITVASENSYIQFDEIVLVEPGETGSVFGTQEFYDYVVVEGSKDFGETWTPLADGYDSRAQSAWLARYNSSFSGNNSTAVGIPSLYRTKTINLQNAFEAGDNIIIRFRLYSDQLAAGWGWAIDNLYIQDIVTSAETDLETSISVYPNPAYENLIVEAEGIASPDFSVRLINIQGQPVYSSTEAITSGRLSHVIPVTGYARGLYLVKISTSQGTVTKKVLLGE